MTTTTFDPQRANPFTETLSVQIGLDEREVVLIQSQHIRECFFVEDIFSHCLIGKLMFTDVHGLFERGPLTGNEIISLIYGVEETREIVFDIWKVSNIIQASNAAPTDETLIELIFVDTSFYNMFISKHSFSFGSETIYTNMVDYLLKNMCGWDAVNINIEPCSNFDIDPFALPYWSVSESINFILKRAKSTLTNKSGYLCFNNTEDGWKVNVKTMDSLFGTTTKLDSQTYIFEDSNENLIGHNKIYEWWIEGMDKNTMSQARGGVWKGFDTKQKKFLTSEYTYADGIQELTALGKKSLYSDISDVNSFHRLTGEKTEETLNLVRYDNWVKNYNVQQEVNIITPGNEKRFCGSQIEIEWPSTERHSFGKGPTSGHKQMKGKYLIKTIIHSFTGESTGSNINYIQKIKLLKNAYQESDAVSLLNIPAENQNIGVSQNTENLELLVK